MARKKIRRQVKVTKTMPTRRRRVYSAARRVYHRARGGFGGMGGILGKLKPVLVGGAGGLAYNFGKGMNSQFGGPAGLAAVGYFGGNETLMTLAGIELSQTLMGAQSTTSTGGFL